jgi:transcriptional regulator with PAS, ATPase and Fis domain
LDRRIAKFQLSTKGTLLLDEISEMAPALQAKLLRAIQEREIDRVGGKSPIPLDVRIISTTNRDLLSEVKQGRFREDLYYRLNVFPIELPPLRERREDIEPLAKFFLARLSRKMGRAFSLSPALLEELNRHVWEGNVRELENYLYRLAVISSTDILQPSGQQQQTVTADTTSSFQQPILEQGRIGTIKDMEREMIIRVLKEMDGNRTRTAEKLGVSVRTIRNKIKEYAITDLPESDK